MSLHGQSKDALAKTQIGGWRYDVTEAGFKCNMTDVLAAIGLVELQRYDSENLPKRKWIFDTYSEAFAKYPQFKVPVYETADKTSSYHLYLLRINNIIEEERDKIIQRISEQEVSVNVHYLPLPMLSFYKNEGYDIENYPVTYHNYACEITLPVYYDLTKEQDCKIPHKDKGHCESFPSGNRITCGTDRTACTPFPDGTPRRRCAGSALL